MKIERDLDLVVLYAAGDVDGPLAGEVRIGLSSRRAYPDEIKTLRTYRSTGVAVHLEAYISGKGAGARLKSAIEHALNLSNRHRRASWWQVSADELPELVAACAASERIRVMSESDAVELETKELHKLMDQFA